MAAKLRQLFLILQATFIMPRFTIDPDIARAKTLHKDFYTDPALFALAKEKLFAPSWQFVAGTEAAPEPGDAYPLALPLSRPSLRSRWQLSVHARIPRGTGLPR
jgi:hypothetical protein